MNNIQRKTGQVLASYQNMARVALQEDLSCSSGPCSGTCNCFAGETKIVEALNLPGARPGQTVRIAARLESSFRAALLLYIIPLAGLIIGAVVGAWIDPFNSSDLSSAVTGFGTLATVYICIRVYSQRKFSREKGFIPVIEQIIEQK